MGFFNKVKKALGSKREDVESQNGDENIVNDDMIVQPTPNDKIRNFKYLDDLIHSGLKEIVLDSDIVLDEDEEYKYKKGIKLDVDDLVIEGNGHAIDARKKARIFECTGKNVTIKNILLKNGFSDSKGGAIIIWGGDLTIMGSTLQKNDAIYGGAIQNADGKLVVTGSTFTQNNAASGGAIHNVCSADSRIIESPFVKNTAWDGAAIYNSWRANLTVTASEITENESYGDAGVIFNRKGNFKIFSCEFSGNNSQDNIILNNDRLEIYDTDFKDNQSKCIVLNDGDMSNLSIFNGGFMENDIGESVLSNSGKFCIVEKTVFQNNISGNGMNIINKSELTLTNPKIEDKGKSILNQNHIIITPKELENKICGEGTVEDIENRIPQGEKFDFGYLDEKIHQSNAKEIILDHDITLENYEMDFYEGGIELDMDDLIIDGNGKAIDGSGKSRIFIITGKNIILKNIVFKKGLSQKNYDNFLNNNGGAIKVNINASITIENCKFINNVSEEYGGAIDNSGELTIEESVFAGNTALDEYGLGGAIKNTLAKLTLINSTFTENKAKIKGGAIYNGDDSECNIIDSTLQDNSAEDGGAISNVDSDLSICNSLLHKNTAKNDGGDIYNSRGELRVIGSAFDENTADKNGMDIFNSGAVFSKEDVSGTMQLHNDEVGKCYQLKSLRNNQKDFNHLNELIHSEKEEIILEHDIILDIENNEDKEFKKGIEIDRNLVIDGNGHVIDAQGLTRIFRCTGKSITIKNITLKNGFAKDGGGAIYNDKGRLTIHESTLDANRTRMFGGAVCNYGVLTIAQSSLMENTANRGGAISNEDGDFTITRSSLKRNTAEYIGGAISNDGGDLTIDESALMLNAAYRGGAISNEDGDFTITRSSFEKNTASSGGAMYNDKGRFAIHDSALDENTAESFGGAIYNDGGEFAVTGSSLEKNTASSGGAIKNDSGEFAIAESSLAVNAAENYGGAIINDKGELTITRSILEGNAAIFGGAINNGGGGDLNIAESTFAENIAEICGGAIALKESKRYESEKCTFKDNKPDDVYEKN